MQAYLIIKNMPKPANMSSFIETTHQNTPNLVSPKPKVQIFLLWKICHEYSK